MRQATPGACVNSTHTVFLTGPIVRMWGFHCPKGWVPFYDFVAKGDAGSIGPGCGDKS